MQNGRSGREYVKEISFDYTLLDLASYIPRALPSGSQFVSISSQKFLPRGTSKVAS